MNSNLQYAKDLLCKFYFDSDHDLVFKDGLVLIHLESAYERGLNILVLHWRDPATSIYNQSPNTGGMIDAILKLNESYTFETLEGYMLKVKNDYECEQLASVEAGLLYNM